MARSTFLFSVLWHLVDALLACLAIAIAAMQQLLILPLDLVDDVSHALRIDI